MSSEGEDEDTGPSIDSNDQDERIAARRLRIQRRIEQERIRQLGEDPSKKKEVKEELSKSKKQIEESRQRLTKLRSDGTELVTNIRVAGDAREGSRRLQEEEGKRQRRERLEAETKAGTERFEEITKKWESALQKEIPQDLHEMLMQQKTACDNMIEEKNKLINDFQMELKSKDDQYVKDLKKQAEDVDLMIERMEEQIKNLTKAYREELGQIEKSFVTERNELLDLHRKKWESTMKNRGDKEGDFMVSRQKRVDDYEEQLQHLRVQDAEEYNAVKISMETDVQLLEQQLQQMKATYQLNQEKLEYNFQVLKKRDEENTLTKNQQKRKTTRMTDVLNNLRQKLAKQEKQYKEENIQLTEDYKRITEQFQELQKKSKHFMSTDARKFYDVWVMNEEECKELSQRVCEQDRIIHEQHLGIPFVPCDISFTENVGPLTSENAKKTYVSATQVLQEVLSMSEADDASEKQSEAGESQKSTILQKISAKTVKQIMELLCDESGFLVENKLTTLLAPLEKDEQSLMKLDAIFVALGVETEDDIFKLSSYFLKHTDSASRKDSMGQAVELLTGRDESVTTVEEKSATDMDQTEKGDEELERVLDQEDSTPRSQHSQAGVELIHPNEVLQVLKSFVEGHHKPPKEKAKQASFKITGTEERDDSEDAGYWEKYSNILPRNKERLWNALLDGLEKYSDCLGSRSKLISETDALRQQNAELRMLLHQYVNSKVNAELEIPPTRILNLEVPNYQ